MTTRNYSNTASEATTVELLGAGVTSFTLTNYNGYPSAPYIAVLDRGTDDEEVVLVTAVVTSTVTVVRGYDGTTAKAHPAGATFLHAAVAKDFDEANTHVNATTGVHGLTGGPVGTSDTQTLTNKTLTSPTITSPTVTGALSGASATFSGAVSAATITATDLTATVGLNVAGDLDVDGATTLNALATSGAATLNSAAVVGGATVGGTLGVTGAATVGGALTVTGNVTATQHIATSAAPTAVNHLTRKDYTDAAIAAAILAAPRGIVGVKLWGVTTTLTANDGESRRHDAPNGTLNVTLEAGRLYRVVTNARAYLVDGVARASVALTTRICTGSPSPTDPGVAAVTVPIQAELDGTAYYHDGTHEGNFSVTTTGAYKLAVWVNKPTGLTGEVGIYGTSITGKVGVSVYDVGALGAITPEVVVP